VSPIALNPIAQADVERILPLMAQFYAEYEYPFRPAAAGAALETLVANEHLGRIWILEERAGAVGYVAVTFGYSLEQAGRYAVVDELYVVPDARHRGAGKRALAFVEALCAETGIRALNVETEESHPGLLEFYHRHGFVDRNRRLLTKPLPARHGDVER